VSVYQEAVLTLTPEYWSGAHSDSIGHWWRKIGKHLGHYEDVDDNTFWEEFKQDQTTLLLEDARDIAVKTKQLITHILNEV